MHGGRQTSEYELSIDGGLSSIRGGPPSANLSGMLTMRQFVNNKQLDVYMKKLRENRIKVERLEQRLLGSKQENDALVEELKACKTKIAVLEEHKA